MAIINVAARRAALDASKALILKATDDVLTQATAVRAVGAWTLAPAPADPVRHLDAAHATARTHLARLIEHDPAREVIAVMTNELFSRLTDAQPAPLSASRG